MRARLVSQPAFARNTVTLSPSFFSTYLSSGYRRSRDQCSPPPSMPTTSNRRQRPRENTWPSCNMRAQTCAPNGTPYWDCRWTTRLPLKQPQPDHLLVLVPSSSSACCVAVVIVIVNWWDRSRGRLSLLQKSVSQRIRNHSARQSRLAATGRLAHLRLLCLINLTAGAEQSSLLLWRIRTPG